MEITAGGAYSAVLGFTPPQGLAVPFPVGVRLAMQVRQEPGAAVLATLTTDNGGLARVSDTELMVSISAAATATFPVGYVYGDVVRLSDGVYFIPSIMFPVRKPVTVLTDFS